MRLIVSMVFGCFLMISSMSWSQENPPKLAQVAFIGKWECETERPREPKRIEISKDGDNWMIEAWLKAGKQVDTTDGPVTKYVEVSLGKTKLNLLGDAVNDKSFPYGFASFESKVAVQHITIRIENDELVLESFRIFKGKNAVANIRGLAKYKKAS